MEEYKVSFMLLAYKMSIQAYLEREIPIGCVIADSDTCIAMAYNKVESNHDATSHAELIAIQMACKIQQNERLNNLNLYTTLEPCPMCAGAIIHARIKNVYYLLKRTKQLGLEHTLLQKGHNHYPNIYHITESKIQYASLLDRFFKKLRK